MVATSALNRDLAYVFLASVAGGFVARRLHQPLILGYVLAGILVGPFTPGPTLSEVHALELLAEVGVILLMYSIGMEFSLAELLKVKWVAIAGAPLGILLSIALGVGMTQIGEFSYVLVQVGRQAGLVEDAVYNATLAASLLSIPANSALMRLGPKWLDRWRIGTALLAARTAGP